MYYSEDLFDRYGLPYPAPEWTWDDFTDALLSVRHPEDGVVGCVAEPSFFTFPLVYQHGGRLFNDWQNPTHTTFDDPLAVDALEWYASLTAREGALLSDKQAVERFGGMQRAIEGAKVGMWAGFLSEAGGWGDRRWPVDWGVVPLPRDVRPATLGLVRGYAIAAQAQHPEACWEWIKFLSQQPTPYGMPPRRSIAESPAYEGQAGPAVAAAARASIEHALIVSSVQLAFQEPLAAFTQAVRDIAAGRSTPEEALHRAQRTLPIDPPTPTVGADRP
jgi:multiple sugar transport system substrate-binding protein